MHKDLVKLVLSYLQNVDELEAYTSHIIGVFDIAVRDSIFHRSHGGRNSRREKWFLAGALFMVRTFKHMLFDDNKIYFNDELGRKLHLKILHLYKEFLT